MSVKLASICSSYTIKTAIFPSFLFVGLYMVIYWSCHYIRILCRAQWM